MPIFIFFFSIADPAKGEIKMTLKKFSELYNGKVKRGFSYIEFPGFDAESQKIKSFSGSSYQSHVVRMP